MKKRVSVSVPVKKKSYKKNYLTNVIFRIDFPQINLNFLEKFSSDIKTLFPFLSKQDVINFILQNPKERKIENNNPQSSVWIFENVKKTKKLHVASNSFVIEYSKYNSKIELLKDIDELLVKFFEYSKIETLNRIGLRYVNQINLNDIKVGFPWNKYISSNLTRALDFVNKNKGKKLAQAISKIVLKESDADIAFVYGIFNSDFPNESVRKEFVLDYDCYSRFPINPQESNISEIAERYNSYIEKLFELSITNSLRKIMNKE